MMEFLYTRMRARRKKMMSKEEIEEFMDMPLAEIIEYLRNKSDVFDLFAKEFGIVYDEEDLGSVMCKGNFVFNILLFERSSKLLGDNKARMLIDAYLFPYKIKMISLIMSALYAGKEFEEVKSSAIMLPSLQEFIKSNYDEVHIYDIVLYLTHNKTLAKDVQSSFSNKDIAGAVKHLYDYYVSLIGAVLDVFGESSFVGRYFLYVLKNVVGKSSKLGVSLKLDKRMKKSIKRYDDKEVKKMALRVFVHEPFTYDALLAYLIMLENEFKMLNAVIKSKMYGERITKEALNNIIEREVYD